MRFFLDSAALADIEAWAEVGLVQGVTTNPALLAQQAADPLLQLRKVADLVDGPVSAQVTKSDPTEMVRQGRALSDIAENIIVKVPSTAGGLVAARDLTERGVVCNITLNFHPAQTIPFVLSGVGYVSLIMGRIEDFGLEVSGRVEAIRQIIDVLDSPTELLVASIRNPDQLVEAVVCGADVVTVPPGTWEKVFENALTSAGLIDFRSAWETLPAEVRQEYEDLST